jgi:hypothetical protein
MKLTFLGTGAGEGYPGLWCDCKHCGYARKTGGKNIRANSCAQVDEDILLDMNAESFGAANRFGLDLRGTRYLLVTHAHQDHFVPQHLKWRAMPTGYDTLAWQEAQGTGAPRYSPLPRMHIVGNAHVWNAMAQHPDIRGYGAEYDMDFTLAEPGVAIEFDNLTVIPVRSIHGPVKGFAVNYILKRGGKTLLYALDTGGYEEDMLTVLRAHTYDCVIMEGTGGHTTRPPGGHMTTEKNIEMKNWFHDEGLLKEGAKVYISHMSPHWTPPYDEYAPQMEEKGMIVAYDGQTIRI